MTVAKVQPSNCGFVTSGPVCSVLPRIRATVRTLSASERSLTDGALSSAAAGNRPENQTPADSMAATIPATTFFHVDCQHSGGEGPLKPPTLRPLCCSDSNVESFLPLTTVQNCPLTRVTPPSTRQLVPFTLQQWLPEAVLFEALKSRPSLPPREQWTPPLTLFSSHLSNDGFHPLCPDPWEGLQLRPAAFPTRRRARLRSQTHSQTSGWRLKRPF